MSVYKKLQHARRQLLAADIKKSGKNKPRPICEQAGQEKNLNKQTRISHECL